MRGRHTPFQWLCSRIIATLNSLSLAYPRESAHTIINTVRDRVSAGHKFADGDISDDILLDGHKLGFRDVPLAVYGDYLGTAIWFYGKAPRPFPCLQIMWQDRNRKFPWEADCILEVKADQPLLKSIS
jgi:hypothetical protein